MNTQNTLAAPAPHNNSKRRREDRALKRSNKKLELSRCWDELNEFHSYCAGMLYQHRVLAQLGEDKELQQYLSDPKTLVLNIRSLVRDLISLQAELDMLYTQHAGRTKGAADPQELMRTFGIAEQYQLFMERHNGVVLPTVYYILEEFQQAEQARQVAKQQLNVQAAAQSMTDTGPIDVVPHAPSVPSAAQEAAIAATATGAVPDGYTVH